MTPLHTQATRITIKVLSLRQKCREENIPTVVASELITRAIGEMLQTYQDELLESQRQAALALDEALGRK